MRLSHASLDMLRQPLPRGLTERDFQRIVIDLAERCGWWCYHTFDSRRSMSGWPDLTLIRGSRLLFLELKTERGRVRPEQTDVIARLQTAGQDARVVRPSAWAWLVDTLTNQES